MGDKAARRIVAALVLLLAAATVAGLLLLQHHGEPGAVSAVNQACGDGQTSGCEDVARSSWSSLAGFPLAGYGLAFYLALSLALALALTAPAGPRDALAFLTLAALALGLLFDLFLFGVQAFAIHAYCKLCLATYVLAALALAVLVPARRAMRTFGSLGASAEGRLAFAGALLGAIAVVAAVVGANATLAERAAARQAGLLGRLPAAPAATATSTPHATPVAPASVAAGPEAPAVGAATPAPVAQTGKAPASGGAPATAGPQDAKYWHEQAQKLQETLDDPRKLEVYFAEKARREFETASVVAIDTDGVAARGPVNAPVKVVEYSDFLCPFCRNLGIALGQFVPQAGGRVVVYYKNFPLEQTCNPKLKQTVHPGACSVALGGVCAQRQGKFEAYHDRVFSTELKNPQPADVVRIAGEAGLNALAVQGCLDDPQTKATLTAQIDEANRLGVNSTPTVYVNGKKLPRINDFVAVVDREAQKKGWKPLGQ